MNNNWKVLDSIDQLKEIVEKSNEKTQVLFKHSTTCGISHGAKSRLEEGWDFGDEDMDFYYLDLLSFRAISNDIAERFSVTHQSPQIIVIKDGKATFNNSHHSISAQSLKEGILV